MGDTGIGAHSDLYSDIRNSKVQELCGQAGARLRATLLFLTVDMDLNSLPIL